jgi:hypothetical protein
MLKIQRKFVESCLLIMLLLTLFLLTSISATAQEPTNSQDVHHEVAANANELR